MAALILGRRRNFGPDIQTTQCTWAAIGAALLWIGWFGFNAGSALTAGSLAGARRFSRDSYAASASSSLVWILLSWKRSGKPSGIAAINGAIAGLAGVTGASGFISVQNSLILGIVIGFISFFAIILLKERLKIDDVMMLAQSRGYGHYRYVSNRLYC